VRVIIIADSNGDLLDGINHMLLDDGDGAFPRHANRRRLAPFLGLIP
jgi:hypothetical protein